MSTQSIQFAVTEAVKNILGGNAAGAWRCRFRNFGQKELPADNVIPEDGEASYDNSTDVERKFKFHVRHLASAVDDEGEPVDGADRAADARYVRGYNLLFADRTLGGLVKIIREVGQKFEAEASAVDTIALVVTYEVEFSTQINDPGTPGY